MGKQLLGKDLEVTRMLKKLTHTKAAIELMLMPNEKGLTKANKKLFPVCATVHDFSDSTSEEENMLALALDQAHSKLQQEPSLQGLAQLGESGNLFSNDT